MHKTIFLDQFPSDINLFSQARRVGVGILILIVFLSEGSFAQITDIFKSIDGVALWGSLGGFYHNEIKTRQIIFPDASLRYGTELLLGPYPDSSKAMNPKYEFGLGTNYTDGYRTNISGFDVRMPIRTIYLAAYIEFQKPIYCLSLFPYAGVSVGINTDLKGTTLDATASADTVNLFQLTGNAIPIEILLGGTWRMTKGFYIFLEMSYEYLAFDGVTYKVLSTRALTANRPKRIDLSGCYLTLGFQFARTSKGD